jgi:hypothetical protein
MRHYVFISKITFTVHNFRCGFSLNLDFNYDKNYEMEEVLVTRECTFRPPLIQINFT